MTFRKETKSAERLVFRVISNGDVLALALFNPTQQTIPRFIMIDNRDFLNALELADPPFQAQTLWFPGLALF